jgi:hypothetical protein
MPFASTRSAGYLQLDRTIDSHLHAVSGVSSCLQRSQVESKHTAKRARDDCGLQSERVATTKKGDTGIEKPPDASVPALYAGPKLVLSISGRGVAY